MTFIVQWHIFFIISTRNLKDLCCDVQTIEYKNAEANKRNPKKDLCTHHSSFWLSGCTFALCIKSTALKCLLTTRTKSSSPARHFMLTINQELSWKWWPVNVHWASKVLKGSLKIVVTRKTKERPLRWVAPKNSV